MNNKPSKIDQTKRHYPIKLCLLIAAHNEELVIRQTIESAINAGMQPQHIYVVDDNSSDQTSKIARSLLGKHNVCRVRRSGKGLALTKAVKKFNLTYRYRWIHLADADGGFMPGYFTIFRKRLRVKYAAATGYVSSFPGYGVSQYRVYEYTLGMEVQRRLQSLLSTIAVIPGPTSCFRSDVFEKLNFATHALCEDFDVTLQIHRQHLGKVLFIPKALAYTQDPKNMGDFIKQITRWNRGVLQGMIRHRVGHRLQKIDLYLMFQIFQNILFFVNYFLIIPYVAFVRHSYILIMYAFFYDIIFTFAVTFLIAAKSERWDVLSAFPYVYLLRWINLVVFARSFVEVYILRKYRNTSGLWATGQRRYVLSYNR